MFVQTSRRPSCYSPRFARKYAMFVQTSRRLTSTSPRFVRTYPMFVRTSFPPLSNFFSKKNEIGLSQIKKNKKKF